MQYKRMVTVFSTKELRNLGFTDKDVRGALACCLRRVRRGRFVLLQACSATEHSPLHEVHRASSTNYPTFRGDIRDNSEHLRILVRSYAEELPIDAVYSHVSAALIHGLDPPFPVTDRCEVLRRGIRRTTPILQIRSHEFDADETMRVGDLRVTPLRRTLLDIASDYSLEFSVPLLSEALHRGLIDEAVLRDGLRPKSRGCRIAEAALTLADSRHESASEALCAVKFFRHGITGMQPQVDTFDADGNWLARNDFRHERLPLIVECHGVGKYFLNEKGPDQASQENHRRHMGLLNAGYRVFNLVWGDLFRTREFIRIKNELAAMSANVSDTSR